MVIPAKRCKLYEKSYGNTKIKNKVATMKKKKKKLQQLRKESVNLKIGEREDRNYPNRSTKRKNKETEQSEAVGE